MEKYAVETTKWPLDTGLEKNASSDNLCPKCKAPLNISGGQVLHCSFCGTEPFEIPLT